MEQNMEQNHEMAPNKNEEIVALLSQIKDSLEKSNRRERRANLLLFINSLGTILVVAAIIFIAASFAPRIYTVVHEVETVLQVLEDANIDKVAKEIQSFAVTGEQALQSVKEAAGQLQALNMDSLNSAIEQLTGTAKSFATINFDKMNGAIENLNGISAKMARFFGVN